MEYWGGMEVEWLKHDGYHGDVMVMKWDMHKLVF